MRLRIVSDLHLEFHQDNGYSYILEYNDPGYDVLILAGDITSVNNFKDVFTWFRNAAGGRPIIFVPGNHEYYNSNMAEVKNKLDNCAKLDNKLHVLDNDQVTIDGVHFIGSTLWFKHSGYKERYDEDMNDFLLIKGIYNWIKLYVDKSIQFLEKNIKEDSIVISHHLPHPNSIHPRFANSPLNKYFLHDVSNIINERQPKLWIHGHTHGNCDYQVNKTRVVCNPFGYVGYELNKSFKDKFTIII